MTYQADISSNDLHGNKMQTLYTDQSNHHTQLH